MFYLKCENKIKQSFENMLSRYIKDYFYLYIACLNEEFKLRKICFPNLQKKKKEKHIKIDDKRVLCSCK